MNATPERDEQRGDDGFSEIVVAAELSPHSSAADQRQASRVDGQGVFDDPYRKGLAVVAAFGFAGNLGFAVLQSGVHASEADTSSLSLLVRAMANLIALVALWRLPSLSRRGAGLLEFFLFATEMLVLLDSQYVTGIHLIDQNDLVDAVAFQKNGVLRVTFLMMCNAVFLPHSPKLSGRIAVTMATALVLCHGFVLEHARTAHLVMDDVASHRVVMFNVAVLVAGAVLATLAAWVLRGQRDVIRAGGRVGPYRLRLTLDSGGMGKVYLADHHTLARPCALKVLRAGRRHGEVDRELFARELNLASMLRHPSAVAIYDCGLTTDGSPYYAMEFLPGLTVAGLVQRFGPVSCSRAIYVLTQVCGVLQEAHGYGLVHRDLSPSNVFIAVLGGQCDVAKLLDFGVAATVGDSHDPTPGRVAGTPAYIAPEQAVRTATVDHRADIYGVGALLTYMLTGHPPYEGVTQEETLVRLVSEPLSDVAARLAAFPEDVKAVVLRCLEKDPKDRFQSAAALLSALRQCEAAHGWNADEARSWWQTQIDG